MKCRKARRLISGFAELKEAQKGGLNSHIAGCSSCQAEMEWHNSSMKMFEQALVFEEEKISWEGFTEGLPLERKPLSWFVLARERIVSFARLVSTPIAGPVPVYVFSLTVMLALGLGIYFSLSNAEAKGLKNIVVYDREYLSSLDDGEKTVYMVSADE